MEMEILSHKFIEEDAWGRIFHVGLFISLMNHCVKRRGKKGKKIELLFVPPKPISHEEGPTGQWVQFNTALRQHSPRWDFSWHFFWQWLNILREEVWWEIRDQTGRRTTHNTLSQGCFLFSCWSFRRLMQIITMRGLSPDHPEDVRSELGCDEMIGLVVTKWWLDQTSREHWGNNMWCDVWCHSPEGH